jgi:hypothetical protein
MWGRQPREVELRSLGQTRQAPAGGVFCRVIQKPRLRSTPEPQTALTFDTCDGLNRRRCGGERPGLIWSYK